MAPTTPTPLTWTLRLKHHRTTVLLHIDPLETLSSLKTELLHALRETEPSGQLNNQPLPDSPDSILLARPTDFNDLRKGWVTLRGASESKDASESDVKKGKRKAGAGGGGDEVSVKSVGLRDNAVVAFKWGGVRKRKSLEEERDEGDEEDEEDGEKEEWDVEVPTYEDTYGIEPEGEGELEGEVGDAFEAEEV